MSMMQEFKTFATKGNVVDLAVGVIIGGAFGKIVDSLVADMVTKVRRPMCVLNTRPFSTYRVSLTAPLQTSIF